MPVYIKKSSFSWLAHGVLAISAALLFAGGAGAQSGPDSVRDIDTARGVVRVKGTPQRVITLSENALDTALAAGIKPVGTTASRGSDAVSAYLQKKAGQPAIVGTAREFNLEAILALQPDLILAPAAIAKDIYLKLSMLAPTIVPSGGATDDWRLTVSMYAEALDRKAEIEQGYQTLDQRIEALRARLTPGQTVSVVRWNPQGPIVMSSRIFTGQLLEQLGLTNTAVAGSLGDKPHSDVLSLENLSKIDADWLFVATLNAKGEETLAAARRQPAFERLDAVRNKHVVAVDGQVWTSGTGLLAADIVLSDLEKALLP